MSDLTGFRDHARACATTGHNPATCPARQRRPYGVAGWKQPTCDGCVTQADQELWARLADEADAYLERNADTPLA